MNSEKRKKIFKAIAVIIIIGIFVGRKIYNSRCITFKDKRMQESIYEELKTKNFLSKGFSKNHITYADMGKVKELHINLWDGYESLEDLQYCRNLESLGINEYLSEESFYDPDMDYDEYISKTKISDKKLAKFQKELTKIMPKLSKLRNMDISGDDRCQITSIAFVGKCKKLKNFTMFKSMEVKDFFPIRQCSKLEKVRIYYSNISDVRDFLYFDNIKELDISYCPAARDFKEQELLEKAYPQADIYMHSDLLEKALEEYAEESDGQDSGENGFDEENINQNGQ